MRGLEKIQLIEVPYHIGYQDEGMARGPGKLLAAGLRARLQAVGAEVSQVKVVREEPVADDFNAILGVNKAVRQHVGKSLEVDSFPLVLSGGCSASLGVLSAMDTQTTGIIWFDAHGDYNTLATTPSGYFGGMPLAVANGLDQPAHWQGLTDQPVVRAANTILIGIRDLDPGEKINLETSGARVISGEMFADSTAGHLLRDELAKLRASVQQVYLHLDIDVLDPVIAPGVTYPSPGGLSLHQLTNILKMVGNLLPVRAAALTAYNPAIDVRDQTRDCSMALAQTLAGTLQSGH